MSCAPVYCEPEGVRRAALDALDSFESLDPRKWVDAEYMPLGKDASFHYIVRDEQDWKVKVLQATVAVDNALHSASRRVPSKDLRLEAARRALLISVLVHIYLWGRGGVVSERGESVAMQDRRVLSPDVIMSFIRNVRKTDRRYPYEQVRGLLEKVPAVILKPDTSSWNEKSVWQVVLCWDAAHNGDEDLWCSCRVNKPNLSGEARWRDGVSRRVMNLQGHDVAPPSFSRFA